MNVNKRITNKEKKKLEYQTSKANHLLHDLNLDQIQTFIHNGRDKKDFFSEFSLLSNNHQQNNMLYNMLNNKKLLMTIKDPICWYPIIMYLFPDKHFNIAHENLNRNKMIVRNLISLSSVCKSFYLGIDSIKRNYFDKHTQIIEYYSKVSDILSSNMIWNALHRYGGFRIGDFCKLSRVSKTLRSLVSDYKFDIYFPIRLVCSNKECSKKICTMGKLSINHSEKCISCNGHPELLHVPGPYLGKTYCKCAICNAEFFLREDYLGIHIRCPYCRYP